MKWPVPSTLSCSPISHPCVYMQARIQGMFAAHAMAGVTDEMAFGFNFELFTHITRFCGRKVVLLGLYNGQGLDHEPEEDMVTYSRTTEVALIALTAD